MMTEQRWEEELASQGAALVPWNDEWRILGSVLFCLKTSFSNEGVRLVMAFDN